MGDWTKHLSMTPRQHDFRDRIQLPRLLRYPLPPDCLADEPEDKQLDWCKQREKKLYINNNNNASEEQVRQSNFFV